ncbi:MAG: hypothetical protein QOF21_2032 [Actinomycetota bacterium]
MQTVTPREIIVAATRAAALEATRSPWLVTIDAGATLAENAFASMLSALRMADAAIVYTDERSRVAGRAFFVDVLKPGWSPRLLLEGNYFGDLCAVRVDAARAAGGYDEGDDPGAVHRLLLRMVERGAAPVHVPVVAIETTSDVVWPPTANELAWQHHEFGGAQPPVAIVIPTRDRVELLRRCVDSVVNTTNYPDFEIVVIDNGSTDAETLAYLDAIPHRVVRHPGPFNFSDLVNAGAAASTAPLLVLLNNDTEMIQADWLTLLVDELAVADVGAVGCRLVGIDGEAQHEGIALGMGGLPAMNLDLDHFCRLDEATRDVAAVTAACVLVPRSAFDAVHGFDHELAVGYGDVDFCLRLRAAGYRVVYTPRVTIRHLGQASRGTSPHPDDDALFGVRWPIHRARANDPYTHPRIEGFVPLWVTEPTR